VLEDRRLLSITVNTLVDENNGIGVGGISLRDAIAAATPGEIVNFSVTGTMNLTLGELLVSKGLTITGPGPDLLTLIASDPTPDMNNGDGSRVFNITNGNDSNLLNVAISGLALTGGDVTGKGGAIFSQENLALTDCLILNNAATDDGGAIYNQFGSLTVTSSMIRSNAGNSGGGVFSREGALTIETSTVEANSGNVGGGIRYAQGTALIDRSTVRNNVATGAGGGIHSTFATLQVRASSISGNIGKDAGGLYSADGSTSIIDSTISGNQATGGGGGGIWHLSGGLAMSNSTVSGNSATGDGGGLHVRTYAGQSARIAHSTIAFNQADSDNSNSGQGGGVFIQLQTGAPVTISHVIVADNSRGDVTGMLAAQHSLITANTGATITDNGGNQIGTAAFPMIAMLGPLADNGGPTMTHAILAASPAVDAGELLASSGENNAPQHDQRGNSFTRVAGARIDIGAFEAHPVVMTTAQLGDYNANGEVDAADYVLWRKSVGQAGAGLAADGNGDGSVNQSDHDHWRGEFGNVLQMQSAMFLTPLHEVGRQLLSILGTSYSDNVVVERRGETLFTSLSINGGVPQTLSLPAATIDEIFFRGYEGHDRILNLSGLASTAHGDEGDDTLIGGANADIIFGGSGDDNLFGGLGADSIDGGIGRDYLVAELSADTFANPNDKFFSDAGDEDRISGFFTGPNVGFPLLGAEGNIDFVPVYDPNSNWTEEQMDAVDHAFGILEKLMPASFDNEQIRIELIWDDDLAPLARSTSHTHAFRRTFYPSALANHLQRRDLNGTANEFLIRFSSEDDWYFGTDANPSDDKFDFVYAALHEIGHGLGFLGGGGTILESFLQTIGDDTFWFGPEGKAGNGGNPPRMENDDLHLNENHHDTDDIMTPFAASGEAVAMPSDCFLGMLVDMGWDVEFNATRKRHWVLAAVENGESVSHIRPDFGAGDDEIPLTGDWDGDGRKDLGLYRPNHPTQHWALAVGQSAAPTVLRPDLGGGPGEIPLVGDWDGDGRDDIGLYRPSSPSQHWVLAILNGGSVERILRPELGAAVDEVPIVGDWDGNDDDDIGLYRPNHSTHWVLARIRNSDGAVLNELHPDFGGGAGEAPVIGDWDGDNDDDIGLYRPTNNSEWALAFLEDGVFQQVRRPDFGGGVGEQPVVGDWDKDGDDDIGVYRPLDSNNEEWALAFLDNDVVERVRRPDFGGGVNELPLIGDWDADGDDDIGVYRPLI
jgi:hypothetical protein